MTDPTPTEATPETDAPLIRTVIVDDHAVVRSGLRKILEAEPDIEVVGEAGGRPLADVMDAGSVAAIITALGLGGVGGALLRSEHDRTERFRDRMIDAAEQFLRHAAAARAGLTRSSRAIAEFTQGEFAGIANREIWRRWFFRPNRRRRINAKRGGFAKWLAKRRRLTLWPTSSQRPASGWGSGRSLNRARAPGELGCFNWPCGQNPGRKPAISRRAYGARDAGA